MNRLEFMKELEALLSDIPQGERKEALQYYNDYLNDAGVENEQEVLESLGRPQDLARVIREGLGDSGEKGEFTETGYRNEALGDILKNEIAQKERTRKENGKKKDGRNREESLSGGKIALIILLCLIALPILKGILAGVFGAGVGLLGGVLGIVFGAAAAGLALLVAAVILVGVGMAAMLTAPLTGMCYIGLGILLAGFSLICLWLTVWMFGVAVPWFIRKTVKICNRLFHGREGKNA